MPFGGQGFGGAGGMPGFGGAQGLGGNMLRFLQQAQQAMQGGIPPWGGGGGATPPWAAAAGAAPWAAAAGGASPPWAAAAGAAPWAAPGATPPWARQASRGSANAPPRPPWTPLVPMKPYGSKRPLFCVHAVLGSAFPYQSLAVHLDPEQPFYGIQSRGLDGGDDPIDDVDKMARAYVDAIRVVQPKGPYNLGGYSFGGAVALAMAQTLVKEGEQVGLLAMFGTGAPMAASSPMMAQLAALLAGYLGDLRKLAVNAFLAENPWAAREGGLPGGIESMLSPMQRVAITNQIAALRYVPRPYVGGVELFVTRDQQAMTPLDPTFGWAKLCAGPIETQVIDGSHLSIFQEPQVGVLARKLTAVLDRAP
jgi:thioesterase domain-containing protein